MEKTNPANIVRMIERALIGKTKSVELATCTFIAGGHLLIEDVPGVGKTTLARAMAAAFGGEFSRIQFTSDLLPSDITGVSVWDPKENTFKFKKGPVFANVVLSDEINRAPPKTQSALLEAMSEKQVSVEGKPRKLPTPFMVIATQNVQEQYGTYPLPESQMDRFTMRLNLGYADAESEKRVISRSSLADPVEAVEPVVSPSVIAQMTTAVDTVKVDESIVNYIMSILAGTRNSEMLSLGVGPRGGMALHRSARALALLRGREYALVDDVKDLAVPVLAHRTVPATMTGGEIAGRELADRIIREIVDSIEVPI